ncbi:MAG: hypothetical protein RIS00_1830 [Pseudomonadota bacterium]|jgi:cholesterol transport system auxiliary component
MMTGQTMGFALIRKAMLVAPLVLLSGCVSFGTDAPPTMLVLKADSVVSAGNVKSGEVKDALVIMAPEAPRKLDTNRVAVQVDASNIAYLKDAIWSDKPTVLMQQLVTETLSARSPRLILTENESAGRADSSLSGQLLEFGIDSATMEAVASFDAVRSSRGSPIIKRRFEVRVPVTKVDARNAGVALNEAANQLALEIADWVIAN